MTSLTFKLDDEQATLALGTQLAELISAPMTLYLTGSLGAGKTTFSRGFIQALGHVGAVKSPTYTLVEPYSLRGQDIFHFDLYRLNDPEELEFMGIRDYFTDNSICLIEWPDRGFGLLSSADLTLNIEYVDQARQATLTADSELGLQILSKL